MIVMSRTLRKKGKKPKRRGAERALHNLYSAAFAPLR